MKSGPNLPLLEEAAEAVPGRVRFCWRITLGLMITDSAGAPIRGTNDVDVIAEILTYPDYIAFSERLLLIERRLEEITGME